jgi:hypothetical protein
MTYVLVCALCSATPQLANSHLLALRLAPRLALAEATPPLLADLRDGPRFARDRFEYQGEDVGSHGTSHMGPMWIVMGVMMVAMMAVLGVYMMRSGNAMPVHGLDVSLPSGRAAVEFGGLRFHSG